MEAFKFAQQTDRSEGVTIIPHIHPQRAQFTLFLNKSAQLNLAANLSDFQLFENEMVDVDGGVIQRFNGELPDVCLPVYELQQSIAADFICEFPERKLFQ